MSCKHRKYSRKLGHSYTCGIYPTMEALRHRAGRVREVLIRGEGPDGPGVRRVKQLCRRRGIRVQIAPRAIARIAREDHPVVGVFDKYCCPVDLRANHVVLVRPRYMGNVGTIIRSMVGFGLHDLVLVRPAPDVFDPAVIRGSMGAIFQVRWSYYDAFEAYRSSVPHTCYCLRPHDGIALGDLRPQPPFALVFGNEGSGLDETFAGVGPSVRIPHHEDIDSLNLAIAAGIVLYHVGRPSER